MSEERPRILLADDHPMILEGLTKLLSQDFEIVGVATDGQALLAAVEHLRPGLVITDIGMPGLDGIEATRRLRELMPAARVLVLSVHAEPSLVQAAFEAGAWGYLPKTSAPGEVEHAVREVLAGCFYVSPAVARAALAPPARQRESSPQRTGEALTARELEVLRLVAEGLGNEQIGRRLGVAVTTVRTHLSSLYEKLGIKSRVELALHAAHSGDMAA